MAHHLTPAEKKKQRLKKNQYQQMLYEMVRLRRYEAARVVEEVERQKPRPADAKSEDEVIWSAKVGEVRNRLTNKKRASQDRWNRFAGTEGGGGRGL